MWRQAGGACLRWARKGISSVRGISAEGREDNALHRIRLSSSQSLIKDWVAASRPKALAMALSKGFKTIAKLRVGPP
jgi:hypothetical protein